MARYYYTDPIKATWMAREFQLGYDCFDNDGLSCADDMYESVGADDFSWKYYLHQYCYDFIKPQGGDVGKDTAGFRYIYSDLENNTGWFSISHALPPALNQRSVPLQIIERNGIAFFMPEVEGD